MGSANLAHTLVFFCQQVATVALCRLGATVYQCSHVLVLFVLQKIEAQSSGWAPPRNVSSRCTVRPNRLLQL